MLDDQVVSDSVVGKLSTTYTAPHHSNALWKHYWNNICLRLLSHIESEKIRTVKSFKVRTRVPGFEPSAASELELVM